VLVYVVRLAPLNLEAFRAETMRKVEISMLFEISLDTKPEFFFVLNFFAG
jgi:hypothetical protein